MSPFNYFKSVLANINQFFDFLMLEHIFWVENNKPIRDVTRAKKLLITRKYLRKKLMTKNSK